MITQKQSALLQCIYTYRYTNRQLIAETLGLAASGSLHSRLRKLEEAGLITRRFEKRSALLGKPVAYFLTPKGLREIAKLMDIPASIIKQSYKDKSASESFIEHNMHVHSIANKLRSTHKDLKIYTKRDMARFTYFPKVMPDLFLSHPARGHEPKRYFLFVIPATQQRYQFDAYFKQYQDYFEADKWEVVSETLPELLFVTGNATSERMVRRRCTQLLASSYLEVTVLTVTISAVQSANQPVRWSSLTGEEEVIG